MKIEQARRELNTIDYFLQNHVNDYPESCHSAIVLAVKSLEAWDKVLDELREYGSICVEYTAEDDKVDAVVDSVLRQAKQAVLEIISKHLAEVNE